MRTAEPKDKVVIYLPISLRREVIAAAEAAGQSLSVWGQRAFEMELLKGAKQQ